MQTETKFKVYATNRIFGYERINDGRWEWMCLELNPDKGERWIKGTLNDNTPLIRCQYTGLKDKNGKEIYEGDIVKHCSHGSSASHVVIFQLGTFRIKQILKNGNRLMLESQYVNIEVIGNIYENPELLK